MEMLALETNSAVRDKLTVSLALFDTAWTTTDDNACTLTNGSGSVIGIAILYESHWHALCISLYLDPAMAKSAEDGSDINFKRGICL